LLAILGETFNEPVSAARAAAYWMALEDVPMSALREAVFRAIRQCKFFPRPAELLELAGAGVPDAGLVNALISEHVGTVGGDRRMPRDPFLRLVVTRLGGILRASDMSAPERIRLLDKLLPGVTAACAVRGIPMPTEARIAGDAVPRAALPEPAIREGEPDEDGLIPIVLDEGA